MSSRRARLARKTDRLLIFVVAAVLLVAGAVIWYIGPREEDKPLVTMYERPDCGCCHLWAEHMRSRGFRVEPGPQEQWTAARARIDLPEKMRACHTAMVDGLLIEGHVPARDVRQVLQQPDHAGFIALVVPDMPRGSPGMDSLLPEAYKVYGVRASGEIRPLFDHDEHEIH
jgi:hypothetical protein